MRGEVLGVDRWVPRLLPLASRVRESVPRPASVPRLASRATSQRRARPPVRSRPGPWLFSSNCSCSWMIMKFERGKRLALRFPLTIIVYSWGISLRIEIGTICLRSLLGTHVSPCRIHNTYVLQWLGAARGEVTRPVATSLFTVLCSTYRCYHPLRSIYCMGLPSSLCLLFISKILTIIGIASWKSADKAWLTARPRGVCKIVQSFLLTGLDMQPHCLPIGQFVTIFSIPTSTRAAAGVFLK